MLKRTLETRDHIDFAERWVGQNALKSPISCILDFLRIVW
jgi:hypothetical protein